MCTVYFKVFTAGVTTLKAWHKEKHLNLLAGTCMQDKGVQNYGTFDWFLPHSEFAAMWRPLDIGGRESMRMPSIQLLPEQSYEPENRNSVYIQAAISVLPA